MKTTFIYALCEPDTGKIRYLGKSNTPEIRFKRHLKDSVKYDSYLGRWLRVLDTKGQKPLLEVLDEVPDSQWGFWEREYIRVFRAVGMNLVNTSDGGDGVTFTPEVRAKMSAANLGKKHTIESREKMSRTRKNMSQETRAKMSASHRGSKWSEKRRAARATKYLLGWSPSLGRKASEETRAKMSASHKARWKKS